MNQTRVESTPDGVEGVARFRRPPKTTSVPSCGKAGSAPAAFSVTWPPFVPACPDLSGLAAVQARMMHNYLRLARASEALRRRRRPARRNAGSWLAAQLERERARLGRELHAGAGQSLAGIRIHLEIIDALPEELPAAARESLQRIGRLAQDALDQLRAVSQRVHPPDWQRLGLEEAIGKLWDLMGIPRRFEAELSLASPPMEPPLPIRAALYRTVQEALTNIVRHAGASRVSLRLEPENGRIRLTVEDNGKGFDAVHLLDGPKIPTGIGLRSMRDQIAQMGGEFGVDSSAGGTRLTVSLPLDENS